MSNLAIETKMKDKCNNKMETQTMTPETKRRSVRLTREEHVALKKYQKKYNTQVECAEVIGIGRVVLNSVLLKGSGAPETISKIRTVLENENNVQ